MGSQQSSEISRVCKALNLEKEEARKLFQSLSARFPFGSIPREQLSKIVNLTNPTAPMVDSLYFLFDTNNDGVVSIAEYVVTMVLYSKATPEEKVLFAFEVYDTDRTGKITKDEVERMIFQLYRSFPKEFQKCGKTVEEFSNEFFAKLDSDKDGSISREEFVKVALDNDLVSMALQNTLNTTL